MSPNNDQPEHVSIREFDGFKTAIVNAIAQSDENTNKRFDAIERRFDNGQKTTNDLLRITGQHGSKLEEHERRFNSGVHKHGRKDDPPPAGDHEPITVKDVKRAAWVVGIVMSAITGIVKFGPLILKALAVSSGGEQ